MPFKALLIVATLSQLTLAEGEPLEENLFAPEVRLEAGGVPIDVVVGHAAPYVIDFDGDGLRDLLVGEFGSGFFAADRLPKGMKPDYSEGKLRIYRNVGTTQAPVFKDFEYLRAGKEFASIPTT